ncbi:MAG: Erf family protein [Mycoplasmataceae bacterium RV_VA103A]|nr:MAG: Erf family protein [Mycoplasmataceae bacterium RV_VA103A]
MKIMVKKVKELSQEQKEAKEETTPRNLYQKLQLIQSQIGQLEKTRENKFQKYFYAGEYDLLKVIKPWLANQRLVLIFSDELNEQVPLVRERLEKEWLVQYLKKAELINADNSEEKLTYYFWTMATNTDLAKAKGSAETYAVKYFLQKFFLLPVDSNLDPDAFDNTPKESENVAKTPPKPTITTQQVESLINLFRTKTADNKERQTAFLNELDKVLEKRGVKGKTTSGNFRERLSGLWPVDYQWLYNWLLKNEF